MSLAYTTRFHSLDNVPYEIEIYVEGFKGQPIEISLEGDEPCIIDWPETDKMDVVQSSTCTLRVSNESDRQMIRLMDGGSASIFVYRNGKKYWQGTIDDSVYEEPYSFKTGYVTEITFSDFGCLNRIPFEASGRHTVNYVINHCLDEYSNLTSLPREELISLKDIKTQQPIALNMLWINTDRFKSDNESWGKMTSRRDVLEEILRPLGLRIMQKNGQIHIYDIDYLRDHVKMQNNIVWKGTDAYIRGSETFGWYEVSFEHDAEETLAEIRPDSFDVGERYGTMYHDDDSDETGIGFYVQLKSGQIDSGIVIPGATTQWRYFNTRSFLTSSDDKGYAWRVRAYDRVHPSQIPPLYLGNETVTHIASSAGSPVARTMFKIESGYLPLVPDNDQYQLRINLDLLLSPKLNPFEGDGDWNVEWSNQIPSYKNWKEKLLQVYVPVKLELLDEQGDVLMHYRNTNRNGYFPVSSGQGQWEAGSGSYGDMLLAYYNDGLEETALEGWATNKQTMNASIKYQPSLYKKRADGEYVPMPSSAGVLRLSVSNCVFSPKQVENQMLVNFKQYICWQMYRNAKITLVKADTVDDSINTDSLYERDMVGKYGDNTSETVMAGSWDKGVAPSSRGLFFDSNGIAFEKFLKDGYINPATLQYHRLRSLEDQTFYIQPIISGSAELDAQFFAKRERSTSGVFLVTGLRQDLHQATEKVTMARIANVGGFCYEYSWSDAICVMEDSLVYGYDWSNPICVKQLVPYSFAWNDPICQVIYKKPNQ